MNDSATIRDIPAYGWRGSRIDTLQCPTEQTHLRAAKVNTSSVNRSGASSLSKCSQEIQRTRLGKNLPRRIERPVAPVDTAGGGRGCAARLLQCPAVVEGVAVAGFQVHVTVVLEIPE